jgi:hypothetical protein
MLIRRCFSDAVKRRQYTTLQSAARPFSLGWRPRPLPALLHGVVGFDTRATRAICKDAKLGYTPGADSNRINTKS